MGHYSAHHRGQRQADRRLRRPEGVGGVQAHFSQRLRGTGAGTSSDPPPPTPEVSAIAQWLLWGVSLQVGDGERKEGPWIQGSHHPPMGTTCQTYCPVGPG